MIQTTRTKLLPPLLVFSLFYSPVSAMAADPSMTAAPATTTSPAAGQSGNVLTIEEAVRIALENHSSIKSARYQVSAQDAVLHQQMAAYYPTISFANTYRTASSGGSSSQGIDSFGATGGVSMTLYNFGKREGTVQSARDTLEATEYAYHATANNTVLSVKQAYYGVLQANALLRVSEETVRDRQEILRQTQGFYDVGTKPKSDVTQAQANLYIAQANLILARNAVDTAWATLKNAMGVDDYPPSPLADELSLTPFTMSLGEAKTAAFAARPELRQFESLLKAEDQQIAVARRNHLPDFLFSSSFGRQSATDQLPHNTWQVQLSLNIPIFNGFQTTYQVQQAINSYYSIREQERLQRQQVALQVEQSYRNVAATREAVAANEAAVKAAKENLELHEGRYQVGYAPIVEVTDAQTTYVTAQTNYVNALVAYKLAMAQLVNAMGGQ
jgi:TolC family type I secretion outer membrane protein